MITKDVWILESVSTPLHWFKVLRMEGSRVVFKNGRVEGSLEKALVLACKTTPDNPVYLQRATGAWVLDLRRDVNTEEDDFEDDDPTIHMDRSSK